MGHFGAIEEAFPFEKSVQGRTGFERRSRYTSESSRLVGEPGSRDLGAKRVSHT
jgi:hypothetical protein